MFITRTPLLNLGLCLGVFLVVLPHSTAYVQKNYSYPDGSTCYTCDYKITELLDDTEQCFLYPLTYPSTNLYCTAPGDACNGTYYPPGYGSDVDNTIHPGDKFQEVKSINRCQYQGNNHSHSAHQWVENCCFKPGSIVSISNLLV